MGNYQISKSWLTRRDESDDPDRPWRCSATRPRRAGRDELWHFDEPAPPGINAGAMGLALLRDGEPIRTTITAIH